MHILHYTMLVYLLYYADLSLHDDHFSLYGVNVSFYNAELSLHALSQLYDDVPYLCDTILAMVSFHDYMMCIFHFKMAESEESNVRINTLHALQLFLFFLLLSLVELKLCCVFYKKLGN